MISNPYQRHRPRHFPSARMRVRRNWRTYKSRPYPIQTHRTASSKTKCLFTSTDHSKIFRYTSFFKICGKTTFFNKASYKNSTDIFAQSTSDLSLKKVPCVAKHNCFFKSRPASKQLLSGAWLAGTCKMCAAHDATKCDQVTCPICANVPVASAWWRMGKSYSPLFEHCAPSPSSTKWIIYLPRWTGSSVRPIANRRLSSWTK